MNADDLVALNEEIAGMARAGLPLDQGLAAMAREMGRGRLQQVTAALAADLQAGHTLPQALERQGSRVPPFYAVLVAAGIRIGRLHEVLATLSLYARSLVNLRNIVVDALFYPAVVLGFGLVIFGFVCVFILPKFGQMYSDFKMRLPFLTEWFLALGRHPLEYVFLPLAGLVIALLVLRLVIRAGPKG